MIIFLCGGRKTGVKKKGISKKYFSFIFMPVDGALNLDDLF
jgi:hypothetical protein